MQGRDPRPSLQCLGNLLEAVPITAQHHQFDALARGRQAAGLDQTGIDEQDLAPLPRRRIRWRRPRQLGLLVGEGGRVGALGVGRRSRIGHRLGNDGRSRRVEHHPRFQRPEHKAAGKG